MSSATVRFDVPTYDFAAACRLSSELGVSNTLAQILLRRGFGEVAAARAFLAADVGHSLEEFPGLQRAAGRILGHVDAGSRMTVHGDYDADGVCSTAILVRVLRTLGADVDWYLPSRSEDGYGVSSATIERLAARGTNLLITTDCGVTAVEQIALAQAHGLDVVVTDHHAPRADGILPAAELVHPALNGYPCPDLCAAGVAYKLAGALLVAAGLDADLADEDLDLVAVATVADVVSLSGENRKLVRAGLRCLAATRKPGLRALMEVAQVDPGGIDATQVAFRLAPRLNAVGRVRRPDAALELLLCEDGDRARAIACELDDCNAERRDVERHILFEAEAQASQQKGAPALVLAAEGWHPGVVGIVASRIVERYHRPAVLIALDGSTGTGSGRSIPAFDLLSGMHAASNHLLRHGGHRAAAGLTIDRECVDAFRADFVAHAGEVLSPEDFVPVERIDAVVSGDALDLDLAEELQRLAPFGAGNPGVSLLVPGASLDDPRPLADGRHVAFHLTAGGARSRAVCFGGGSKLPAPAGEPVEAAVRLEVNRYNGTEEPRLVLRHARVPEPKPIEILGATPNFASGVLAEVDRDLGPWTEPWFDLDFAGSRESRDWRGRGLAGLLADLVCADASVLAVTAHTGHRAASLGQRVGGFALVSWFDLEDAPLLAADYAHVVLIDPPCHPRLQRLAAQMPGEGWIHPAWGPVELTFSQRILEWEFDLRSPLASVYRNLRATQALDAPVCESLLRGDGRQPRGAALAGRLARVLHELGLVSLDRRGPILRVLPSPERTALERSAAFRAYTERLEEGRKCLSLKQPLAMAA